MHSHSVRELSDEELRKLQLTGLWLDGKNKIRNESDAVRFMRSVGYALRYGATVGLPLASMFKAVGEKRRAIELTNAMLARAEVIETTVIAGRVVLTHAQCAPPLFALRHRFRSEDLSSNAKLALELIRREGTATAGDVRRYLNVDGRPRPDPGDSALAELQRDMLIDRGASSVPEKGIPYLSPEGYPYRPFEESHPDVVQAARKLKATDAICSVIETYLQAAVFVAPRKLAAMFRLLFSEDEMNKAVAVLAQSNKLYQTRRWIVWRG